jgi:uncharacterized membrane protein
MLEFFLALAAFIAAHMAPARPHIRSRLVAELGERGYLVAYSLLSVTLLALLIAAAIRAPNVPLWYPGPAANYVPVGLMPIALGLIGAGAAIANPLSVSIRPVPADPIGPLDVGGTRHPILWGFGLWGLSHVPPTGDLVAVIMFGGFGVMAFAAMPMLDRRRRRELGEARWRELAAGTGIVPLGFTQKGGRRLKGWPMVGAMLGILAYFALLYGGHLWLFGSDPMAPLL